MCKIKVTNPPTKEFEIIGQGKSRIPGGQKYLTFSFRYWKQHNECFGLAKCVPNHFVAFLSALQVLGTYAIDEFNSNIKLRDVFHYHKINWGSKGVVTRRNGRIRFEIPEEYTGPDYPWYQFAITTGKGRFAGFYDENTIFQVVVVDINHNLQPAKKHNYQIQKSEVIGTPYDLLRARVDSTKGLIQNNCPTCPYLKHLSDHDNNVYISIDEDEFNIINSCSIERGHLSIGETLTELALHVLDENEVSGNPI